MNDLTTNPATESVEATSRAGSAYLPLLLLLFAGSGCSALIYEIVWYQALQLAIGSTSVSLGVLLATFMGGLCIGSTVFPRMKKLTNHPLKTYALIELGIAALGIAVQFAMPSISRVYFSGASSGLPGMLLRGVVAAICMLPPTILMGASLPAIVRWLEASPRAVAWWGWLYGGNTAGAVIGCLLAGFWLLREYNTTAGTLFAAAINVIVALVSLVISSSTPETIPVASPAPGAEVKPSVEEAAPAVEMTTHSKWPVYLTIALSGAVALGAEVVWTRLLGYLLLATVYVFSIILAVFLTGLALGTAGGSWLLRKVNPRNALGWCQILLTIGFAWTAYSIVNTFHLPFWNDNVLVTQNGWEMYLMDLKVVAIAIFPATLFWGASFPLACAAVAEPGQDSGKTAGGIYAANTLGGIFGALIVSLILIPAIGSQNSQRMLLLLSAVSGLVVLAPKFKSQSLALVGAVVGAIILAVTIDPVPGELIAYGRFMGRNQGLSEILYTKEGRNSSVAISRWQNGTIYVNVNGHVEATTEIFDMKLQRMVGHLAAILHPNPKSVLGIGFGAGVSAGTFTRYPGIEHITVCEIEPVIPPASTKYFAPQNYEVKNNPKTRIVYDDARHYLMTTNDKYDIIASDPLDVFVKGTAALYSLEYYESVKRHLNPGGIFTLYVPLYETDELTFKSELATFFKAFPNGSVWSNTRDRLGYDMVFMGQLDPLHIDLDKAQARYDLPEHATVRESLHDVGVDSIGDLFSTYTGTAADLNRWVGDSPLNTDADLKLSYLAGWGINADLADYLYRQMLRYRTPPTIFSGSPEHMAAVVDHLTE